MRKPSRPLIALAILLSGLALMPRTVFPAEKSGQQPRMTTSPTALREVQIQGFAFVPGTLAVPVGTTVRWTNRDGAFHTVTGDGGLFNSGTLQPGGEFEHLFDAPGSYSYHCTIHPFMTGTIVVVPQMFRLFLPIVSH